MALETFPFHVDEHIESEADQADLIADAFESGDPRVIANTIGIVARARGMTRIAKDAGVTREALYKALREDSDPRFSTILGVMKALGIKITIEKASDEDDAVGSAGTVEDTASSYAQARLGA